MKAMVFEKRGKLLQLIERPDPSPGDREVLVRIEACAVCRTDLHIVDGDLSEPKLPLVLGHEIVGIIDAVGPNVSTDRIGRRVGIPWLGQTCGVCGYCQSDRENLCDYPVFTGYTRDGGFATHTLANADFAFDIDPNADPVATSPLLCAGLIGWRSLRHAGKGKAIGIYGFGAAAHIIAQICLWQGRAVYAFTRPGDTESQEFARTLGVTWAGGSDEPPPKLLDAAIIFAPVGALVPAALAAIAKGGRVVCGGIHMSDIPKIPYRLIWGERELVSVANLTRQDAREFFPVAREAGVKTHTTVYPLAAANDALADLRSGQLNGAAVLVP